MKFLVVGLGSMGKRRIRLLKSNYSNIELVGVDTKEDRKKEAEKLFNIKTYDNLDKAIEIENPGAVLVCTSPIYHSEIILKCLHKNINIFTEINLLDKNYDDIISLAKSRNLKLFLSSTCLYRNEIKYIKERTTKERNLTYRYHVGQYLPDWHPWESYKDFFVGYKATNGCRELFAIELPWIIDAFGKIESINVVKNKVTNLEIDYPDNYVVVLKHKNGSIGTLNVDVVSRKAIRSFEVYNENIHLFWEGTPDTLNEFNIESKTLENIKVYDEVEKDNRYSENIIENAYLDELDAFIKYLNGDDSLVRYSFEKDKYTLSIIDEIEGDN